MISFLLFLINHLPQFATLEGNGSIPFKRLFREQLFPYRFQQQQKNWERHPNFPVFWKFQPSFVKTSNVAYRTQILSMPLSSIPPAKCCLLYHTNDNPKTAFNHLSAHQLGWNTEGEESTETHVVSAPLWQPTPFQRKNSGSRWHHLSGDEWGPRSM